MIPLQRAAGTFAFYRTTTLAMVLGAVPIALVVFAVIQTLRGLNDSGSLLGLLLDLTVIYPALAAAGAIGALLFAAAVHMGSSRLKMSRWLVLVLTPVAALPWALLPLRAVVFSWPMVAGMGIGLVGLALLIPLPRSIEN